MWRQFLDHDDCTQFKIWKKGVVYVHNNINVAPVPPTFYFNLFIILLLLLIETAWIKTKNTIKSNCIKLNEETQMFISM